MQRITLFERQRIQSGIRVGLSNRAIARSLKRPHSAINYEIKFHSRNRKEYIASTAERIAIQKQQGKQRKKLEKESSKELLKYVVDGLREYWSPEQIAEKTKRIPIGGISISHEAIYQYIYDGKGQFEQLYSYLRRAKRHRQKKQNRKYRKVKIPDRVSIHLRPEEVQKKTIAGHWETDTIESKRGTSGGLCVMYERKMQLVRINKIPNKTAEQTEIAITKAIDSLPSHLFKSITFDNGSETVNHVNLRKYFDLDTYHCDPYASWQKGGVENINGLIRQFIPKKTDISILPDSFIQYIQQKLNNRPRKNLNYLSPNQALAIFTGQIYT